MAHIEYRSAEGWLDHPDYHGVTIMDPDGWDRKNFAVSWAELISKREFESRMCNSTVILRSNAS